MKKIVYCADGTWCHPDNPTELSAKDSNVYKLYKMLCVSATQLPHYDDGIGADGSLFQRLFDGAFGNGLFSKIKDGYTKIAHDYSEGDSIFLFGFSRGAYTARSIAGMIACAGLPSQALLRDAAIQDAFTAYRQRPGSPERLRSVEELATKYGNAPVPIEVIGVWDTVGALGIPSLYGGVDPLQYGFLDVSLSPRVRAAYQALALDEQRAAFPPTLWDTRIESDQTLEQVWFAGCHGNIGGGCPESTLSMIAMKWMVDKCALHRLELDAQARAQYGTIDLSWPLAPVDVPWPGYKLVPPKVREVGADASVAHTIPIRVSGLPSYGPANLMMGSDRILADSYSIVSI